jgi:hypothetical protein
MRKAALLLILFSFASSARAERVPLSYLRAHNFRLSQAASAGDWLLFFPRTEASRGAANLFFAREDGVGALYDDLSAKDSARLLSRLQQSYGEVYDVTGKLALEASLGRFRQRFSVNAAVSLTVNDPVFPELSGILFNDYTFTTDYRFAYRGWAFRPSLTYGLRRTLDRSFTVGQLLDTKPNLKIKAVPYRLFAELGLEAGRSFSWGDLLLSAESLPLRQRDYDYWQVELGYRSPNLLEKAAGGWPKRLNLWAAASPLYGGDYEFGRTLRAGVSVEWFRYLQTDVSFMDKFLPAAFIRVGTRAISAELFTFARGEDDAHTFSARQYGVGLKGAF